MDPGLLRLLPGHELEQGFCRQRWHLSRDILNHFERRVAVMVRRSLTVLVIVLGWGMLPCACSKSDSSPTSSSPPNNQSLTAIPSFASVGVGTSQSVSIGGGTPPYAISTAPTGIATAQLLNSDSLVATLSITGVSVASVGTAVTVRDNSASPAKTVTVPISVH